MRRTSTTWLRRRPRVSWPRGREPALQLRDDPVDLRQVLERTAGQGAVELGQRPGRRQALCALDQGPLELSSQHALEAPQRVAVEPLRLSRPLLARCCRAARAPA